MYNSTISVIVPIYNAEPYLRKCVDSILAQTYTNLEIILADDGSPDNCGAICDEYAQKDKRIIVIHKENGGVSTARNAGLDVAKGEYIAFVDADDYIPKDYLEILYKEITYDVDMVVCQKNSCLLDGDVIDRWPSSIKSAVVLDVLDIRNFTVYQHREVWGVLYKKSVIGDLHFNPDYYSGQDIVFYYSLLKKCQKIKHTPNTSYYYVQTPHSIQRGLYNYDKFEKKYSLVYAHKNLCQLYENVEIKEIFECEYSIVCHIVLSLMRHMGIQDIKKIKFLKHEIRRLLPRGLKKKDLSKFTRAGFIFDAFLPERINMHIMRLYDFAGRTRLLNNLRKKRYKFSGKEVL